MPNGRGYQAVTLTKEANAELRGMLAALQKVGSDAIPVDLGPPDGALTLSDVAIMGIRALRERIASSVSRRRGAKGAG